MKAIMKISFTIHSAQEIDTLHSQVVLALINRGLQFQIDESIDEFTRDEYFVLWAAVSNMADNEPWTSYEEGEEIPMEEREEVIAPLVSKLHSICKLVDPEAMIGD